MTDSRTPAANDVWECRGADIAVATICKEGSVANVVLVAVPLEATFIARSVDRVAVSTEADDFSVLFVHA